MTIRVGDNPENAPDLNKFIGMRGEGHRGQLVALHVGGREAVVKALTKSLDPLDGVEWGRLYLVREETADEYPYLVKRLDGLPEGDDWTRYHLTH